MLLLQGISKEGVEERKPELSQIPTSPGYCLECSPFGFEAIPIKCVPRESQLSCPAAWLQQAATMLLLMTQCSRDEGLHRAGLGSVSKALHLLGAFPDGAKELCI